MPKCDRNFIEVTLRDCISPVNLMCIFRTPFLKSSYGWLLLNLVFFVDMQGDWHFRTSDKGGIYLRSSVRHNA